MPVFRAPLHRLLTQDPIANYHDLNFVQIFAEHRLHNILGRSGKSTVFRATRILDQQEQALKIYNPKFIDHHWKIRKIREMEILLSIPWKRAVRGRSTGVSDTLHYLEMDLAPGVPLDSFTFCNDITTHQRLVITLGILRAVQEVHHAQIIHGDIKPENIMVSADHEVKIVDFGVSRRSDEILTMDRQELVGSMGYIAPELFPHDLETSYLTDIFSLGMTLFYLWTDTHGCLANSPQTFLDRITYFRPEASLLAHGTPQALTTLISGMVACDPQHRIADIDQALTMTAELMDLYRWQGTVDHHPMPKHRGDLSSTTHDLLAVALSAT